MSGIVDGRAGTSNFRFLLVASSISAFGDGMRYAALPLLASNVLSSAISVSSITVATTLPWLLFSIPFGVYIDRYDKIKLMLLADISRGLAAVATVFLFLFGFVDIAVLIFLAFTLSIGSVLYECASESSIPYIVDKTQLESANGRLSAMETLGGSILGSIFGPLLFSVAHLLPFVMDAITFFISAICLKRIRLAPVRDTQTKQGRFLSEALEGVKCLISDRLLLTLTLSGSVLSAVFLGQIAVLVILAGREYGLSAANYGVLLAVGSFGGVFGSVSVARIVGLLGRRITLCLNFLLIAVASVSVLILREPIWLAVALFVINYSILNWSILSTSIRQETVPAHLLGRAAGAYRLVSWGSRPIGALMFGILTEFWDARTAFAVGGIAIACLFVLTAPILLFDKRLR